MQNINLLEQKEKKTSSIIKYRDFYLGDFYLKLELTNNNELHLVNYNTKILDGIKFFLKLNINILQKASDLFKKFDKIENIYDIIIKLIDEKKYKLYNSSNKVIFSIIPNRVINNQKEILLYLNKVTNDINNDFYKVLSNEINKLRYTINKLINPENIENINNNNLLELKMLKEKKKKIQIITKIKTVIK